MTEERSQKQAEEEAEALTKTTHPFEGKIFSVRQDLMTLENNATRLRESVEHPGAVVILPLISDDEILLIKQYRHPIKQILIELPAGLLEKGETPEKRAMKELQEETGYSAQELIPFGGMFSAPGFCSEYLHFFLAKHLSPAPLSPDADEAIDLVPMHLHKALELIDNDTICDAKTIAGILKYVRVLNR